MQQINYYIGSDCGDEVGVLDIMGSKNIEALSRDIAKRSDLVRPRKEEAKAE